MPYKAMADCVFPEEIMLCILTRLPVKSIVRFKSVCKPWLTLFSTPEFKKLHFGQFSSDPDNQSFIIHSNYCSDPNYLFSTFNIRSVDKMPTILGHPFAHAQTIYSYTVGCCNGLVCICKGQEIVLWNPVMKLSKSVPLKDCRPFNLASLGFGYDAMGDDFKVVMIVESITNITSVEIYSANLDSWITIDVGFQFSLFKSKNNLIVNGNPYWFAWVDGYKVLLCFDVLELVFKIVPWPIHYWVGSDEEEDLDGDTTTLTEMDVNFVDLNGALGAIFKYEVEYCVGSAAAFAERSAICECVWIWVFDDIERIWRNNHTFWPIEVDACLDKVLHCTKNEKVLGTLSSGTLFLSDLETGCVKELFDVTCLGHLFEIYAYTESLAHINGMEKVVV
ncbi:hypothetical protein CASFOL_013243 [Castilleja foliolosa]|uniref:F-box domain-containing protein n=1 Tax=Castilleja foliolosa TaxID=1961234 RepID=A0ABD3DJJ6_9LAMI